MTSLRSGLTVALSLAIAGCGGGPAATPTTVVGIWDLESIEGTEGQHAIASNVLSTQLRADGTASYVSCLDPAFDSATSLRCHEKLVCASGSYTFDGSLLVLSQTGRTETHSGTVAFGPGAMTVNGTTFFGAHIKASTFQPIEVLSTDCLPLP